MLLLLLLLLLLPLLPLLVLIGHAHAPQLQPVCSLSSLVQLLGAFLSVLCRSPRCPTKHG